MHYKNKLNIKNENYYIIYIINFFKIINIIIFYLIIYIIKKI